MVQNGDKIQIHVPACDSNTQRVLESQAGVARRAGGQEEDWEKGSKNVAKCFQNVSKYSKNGTKWCKNNAKCTKALRCFFAQRMKNDSRKTKKKIWYKEKKTTSKTCKRGWRCRFCRRLFGERQQKFCGMCRTHR